MPSQGSAPTKHHMPSYISASATHPLTRQISEKIHVRQTEIPKKPETSNSGYKDKF